MLLSGVLLNLRFMYIENLETSIYSKIIANGVALLGCPENTL